MTALRKLYQRYRAGALGLLAAGLCLAVTAALWLTAVRPQAGKSLSEHISDDYTVMSAPLEPGQSAAQTFATSCQIYKTVYKQGGAYEK